MVKKAAAAAASKTTQTVVTMKCDKIAQPIGPYTMGKIITTPMGTWGYTSGQIGMKPNGELDGTKPAQQARRALSNFRTLAKANGFKMEQCIKTTVFVHDMAHFAECNAVYAKFFDKGEAPARSCIAAKTLPKNCLFEIEGIFFKP